MNRSGLTIMDVLFWILVFVCLLTVVGIISNNESGHPGSSRTGEIFHPKEIKAEIGLDLDWWSGPDFYVVNKNNFYWRNPVVRFGEYSTEIKDLAPGEEVQFDDSVLQNTQGEKYEWTEMSPPEGVVIEADGARGVVPKKDLHASLGVSR